MEPRAPQLRGARLVCLGVAAWVGLGVSLPPKSPREVMPGLGAEGCVLVERGTAPPCPEEAIPPRVRWALGLPLRLNDTALEGLILLPGIGPIRASRVLRHRAAHGPFSRLEELARIEGIGPRTVERLRPYLVIGDLGSELP